MVGSRPMNLEQYLVNERNKAKTLSQHFIFISATIAKPILVILIKCNVIFFTLILPHILYLMLYKI